MGPYLPLVLMFALAAGFALFSVTAAPYVGPRRYNRAKLDAYECGIEPSTSRWRRRPVPGEVLPDGDALHRLRHRDRLPLPVGGRQRRLGVFGLVEMVLFIATVFIAYAYVWRRGGLTGTEGTDMGLEEKLPQRRPADQRREAGQLDAQVVAVAGDLRPGLLRDRDDGLRRAALRPGPLRHGGLPRLAAAGRPDDRRRPGEPEDGPGAAPDLRPDARAALGARDGRLRQLRRHVQQLRDRAGRRPHRPGGHVPARLPAAAGDADGRDPQAARTRSRTSRWAPKRAAELAASGHTTELVPSSIKFAPKGKRHERETAGRADELRRWRTREDGDERRERRGTSKENAEPTGGAQSSAQRSGPDQAAQDARRRQAGAAPVSARAGATPAGARGRHPPGPGPSRAGHVRRQRQRRHVRLRRAARCPATCPHRPSGPTAAASTRSPTS